MDLLGFLTKKEDSKDVAKERLKLVLISDRINCSEAVLNALRNDIMEVISKYMEIEQEGFDVHIAPLDDSKRAGPVLYANIPIKNMKR